MYNKLTTTVKKLLTTTIFFI